VLSRRDATDVAQAAIWEAVRSGADAVLAPSGRVGS
jgi:hypothetical protein